MDIVLATRNKKKIEEIQRIVKDMGINIYSLDDFPDCPEVLEDGKTFEENAIKKAKEVAKFTKMPALSDDSGLEVFALNGKPGIFSARYAGKDADDTNNVKKLLSEMENLANSDRGARFVCVIALAFPDTPPIPPLTKGGQGGVFSETETKVVTFSGFVEGNIGREPRGSNGFGYDPVFYPKGHNKTFAEMSSEEKDALSHRGAALSQLHGFLKDYDKYKKN